MQIKKNRIALPLPAAETKQNADSQLAWAVGMERLAQHDSLYYVTETFHETFDRIGRKHALAAAGGFSEEDAQEAAEGKGKEERKDPQNTPERTSGVRSPKNVNQPGEEKPQQKPEANAMTRFSEIAFKRGAMSAAVLNGTGKMMLVSCLKRTVMDSGPKHLQQQRVADTGSKTLRIPGHTPDKMVYNRGFADSALGIVVDTLKDARRVVESMGAMASCLSDSSQEDRTALFKMYPFLDDSRDAALEAEYRDKLARCTDEREKPILQNALVHTISLRAKKAQMKNEFINKLRLVSDRATETLSELEAPGVSDELAVSAFGYREPDLPENPDEGADGDAPNRKKNGAGQAVREDITRDTAEAAN